MNQKAFRYALWSQLSLLGGLLICFLIRPHWVLLNYPVSYFGNFRATIIPYVIGFVLCAYWLMRTIAELPAGMKTIRLPLLLVAVCSLAIPCTPYMINVAFGWIHLSVAVSLLIVELWLSTLLILRTRHLYTWLGFVVLLCGAALAVLSEIGLLHVELIGEMQLVVGSGVLLICSLGLMPVETRHVSDRQLVNNVN